MKKFYFILAMCITTSIFAQNNNPNYDYHPLVQEGKVWSVLSAITEHNPPYGYHI